MNKNIFQFSNFGFEKSFEIRGEDFGFLENFHLFVKIGKFITFMTQPERQEHEEICGRSSTILQFHNVFTI